MTESTLLGHIAGTPWAMLPAALQTLVEVATREAVDPANVERWKAMMAPPGGHDPRQAVAFRDAPLLPGATRARMRDGVAILDVGGPIFRHANLFTQMSGATALGTLATDLQLAADDTRVAAILINLDSPGGQLTGLLEVGDAVRATAERKPVVAFVDGVAASAAYLLAASASEIVLGKAATVGSLGVVGVYPPKGAAGQQPVEIVSSQTPNKRASPHTEEGRARLQAWIDSAAAAFLEAVATHRGLSVEALLEATDGGGLLVGAAAVQAGLADRIGSFEETLARLAGGARPALPRAERGRAKAADSTATEGLAAEGGGPAQTHGDAPMSDPATLPPAPPVAEAPGTPPQPAPAPAPPADPAAEERARVSAILAAQRPGMEKLAAVAVAQGWTPGVFAEAQEAAGGAVLAAQRRAFAEGLPAPLATGAPADLSALPPEERAKAEWESDDKIRAEFGSLGAYLGWLRAKSAGRVRLLSRPAAA